MKKLTLLGTLALCLCAFALAQTTKTVRLIWDMNPPSDNVTFYTVYRSSTSGGPWARVFTVPGSVTNCTVPVVGGGNFWTVSASNSAGESEKSNEVGLNQGPGKPNSLKLQAGEGL